ncbi:hypothetical protein BDY19DRAFT_975168 [Irpex rosettiformis]|uniref:Uncharacterized protein n=1 Tax=Irpex rosettiformis TaxID=378272 RepID=A0ACB8TQ37_9APHY|nr:hypothetical protein BDY19DRAFT_975168 [Irpex rosettiformis]
MPVDFCVGYRLDLLATRRFLYTLLGPDGDVSNPDNDDYNVWDDLNTWMQYTWWRKPFPENERPTEMILLLSSDGDDATVDFFIPIRPCRLTHKSTHPEETPEDRLKVQEFLRELNKHVKEECALKESQIEFMVKPYRAFAAEPFIIDLPLQDWELM